MKYVIWLNHRDVNFINAPVGSYEIDSDHIMEFLAQFGRVSILKKDEPNTYAIESQTDYD